MVAVTIGNPLRGGYSSVPIGTIICHHIPVSVFALEPDLRTMTVYLASHVPIDNISFTLPTSRQICVARRMKNHEESTQRKAAPLCALRELCGPKRT